MVTLGAMLGSDQIEVVISFGGCSVRETSEWYVREAE